MRGSAYPLERMSSRVEALAREPEQMAAHATARDHLESPIVSATAAGVASAPPLLQWCKDQTALVGRGSAFDVAQWFVIRSASEDPRALIDAAGSHGCVLPSA